MSAKLKTFISNYRLHIIVYSLLFTLSGGISYIVANKSKISSASPRTKIAQVVQPVNAPPPSPTPTSVPFKELTIPYLRNRQYVSTITNMNVVADKGSFTAYTASYDSDGNKVNGYLTIPNTEMPEGGWPAVVFVHGYIPPTIYKTLVNYVSYADYLAKNGLVVFKIDLQGHGESEGKAFGAYYSGNYVIDTLNAYSALRKLPSVNPDKVGLWGHSMGGNVTFRSFVAKNIPKLAIWAGAVYTYEDLQEFRIDDNSYRPPVDQSERQRFRDMLFAQHGSFDPASQYWQQVVPTNHLDGLTGSVQIHHAVDDNVVNIDYSRNLIKILDSSGVDNQLIEYSAGSHNLTGASFTQAMEASAKFLSQY